MNQRSRINQNNPLININSLLVGIFRVCFPHEEKPLDDNLYLNPVEEWCFNNDYHVKLLEYGLLPKR